MPAAGTTKIPKTKKARIIAEKRVGMGTNAEIAKKYKVAPKTVRNLVSSPPAYVVPMVEKLTQKFNEEAVEIAGLVFKEIKRRVKEQPKKEATKNLVAVGKMVYDVHRLETNQPTTISQNQKAPVEYALEFAHRLLADHGAQLAREMFRRAQTVKAGIRATDEEWIEVEARVFENGGTL